MKAALLALLALCLSCTPTPGADAGAPQTELARLIQQPETVRIYSARPVPSIPPGQDAGSKPTTKWTRAGMFGFTHEGPVLTEAERQALAKSWVPPQDYKRGKNKMCSFSADIALRFQRADTYVDAVVCFTCGEIWFFDMKRESIDGGGFKNFELLRRLTTQAFPGEKFGNDRDDY